MESFDCFTCNSFENTMTNNANAQGMSVIDDAIKMSLYATEGLTIDHPNWNFFLFFLCFVFWGWGWDYEFIFLDFIARQNIGKQKKPQNPSS